MCLRPALLGLLLATLASGGVAAQPEPVTVVVLGSSNAEGYGPAHADSAWAVRLDRALAARVPGSRVVNLAKGGYTTSHLLPTGTAVPEGRPAPDPERNVTAALAARPDAVVISLTSNDSAREVPVAEQLEAYDAMLAAAGDVPVFVTTTTPRTGGISALGQRLQAAVRDSTLARYGARALDVWSPVATPGGAAAPGLGSGDGVHFTDRAHGLFADVVARALFPVLVPAPPEWDVLAGWTAGWVGAADLAPADTQNVWTAYRATLDLTTPPEAMTVRIAVDSKYWLWVNGEVVVREGGLKRGPMRGATYADVVDLGPHLRAGENTLAVLVWTWGKDGFSHHNTDAPGLLFDLGRGGAALDWRTRRHPAYGDTGPPYPNYRLPESNVRYDARREWAGWTEPGFDDGGWPGAVALAPAGADPWGALVARPIPQWKDYGLAPYLDAPAFPFTATGDTVVVALPYNAQVTPWLDVEAPAGTLIDIRTDNYRGGSALNVRAEVVARAGRTVFEVPGWMNGHAVRYAIPEGVVVHGLRFRETGYDAEFAGSFESSDPALDTLWQKSLRTLYVTMRDTYMDCPDRERAQWWGDVVLEMGESFYALSREADALGRKGILELAAWQRPDSTIYSPVPSTPSLWSAELPTQMLASVGWYGFWTYYLHTGDAETIRRVYPAVRDYLALWTLDADGLVVERPGGWTWGDWGADKDLPLIYNGWYALALKGQREMALLTGHDADVPAIDAALARLTASFNARFWTGAAYRSPGHEGATDDRGNALAVVAGLAPEMRHPALREVLVTERHASPYFEKYVAEALIRMGYTDDALARLKDRYADMIASPLTTLWEGWELNSAVYGGGTYNHAWSGGPLTLLSSLVAGVEPITPGYETVRVAPRLGGVAYASAVVPSVRGTISVDARQTDGAYDLDVTVPDGARALVEVPRAGRRVVRLDGAAVWSADGHATPPPGVEVDGVDGRAVRFWVGSGRWSFRAL